MMLKRFFSIAVSLVFLADGQALAQTAGSLVTAESKGNEYFVGRLEGKPLIKVHLLSGVANPGVYHVPIDSSLTEILSFAGGAKDEEDLSSITIRSRNGKNFETKKYNLLELVAKSEQLPFVKENDIVILPNSSAQLAKAQVWVGIFSAIATVALTVAVVKNGK